MDKKDKIKDKSKEKNKDQKQEKAKFDTSPRNIFTYVVVIIITLTFVGTTGSLIGMRDFFGDFRKTKVENEDGTISIPDDAQDLRGSDRRNGYIGKVLGEKIQLTEDRSDEFSMFFWYILGYEKMTPGQKFNELRKVFDRSINKIIGMHNAQKMDIKITSQSTYFIEEVGKRYFIDEDGDIDYERMKKNTTEFNKRGREIYKELLYNTFVRDYFKGLPMTKEEMWDEYRLDEASVNIDYIQISNNEVNDDDLKSYFESNKAKYKKYKLTRIVFNKKKYAEEAKKAIDSGTSKFAEIGEKIESEQKGSISSDPDYSFSDELDDVIKDEVKKINKGGISNILEVSGKFVIFMVDDLMDADFNSQVDYTKIKSDYAKENKQAIDSKNKNKANEIYEYAKTNGLNEAAEKYNLEVKTSYFPINFMENNKQLEDNVQFRSIFPEVYFDLEKAEDIDFMVELFKGNIGDIVKPRNYSLISTINNNNEELSGYVITKITDKKTASRETFDGLDPSFMERYSNEKSSSIESDYYDKERKKFKIVDNFDYVFNEQMFAPEQQNQ